MSGQGTIGRRARRTPAADRPGRISAGLARLVALLAAALVLAALPIAHPAAAAISPSQGEAGVATARGGTSAAATSRRSADELVFLLQYVGADYGLAVHDGEIVNVGEYAEMLAFTSSLVADYAALRGPDAAPAVSGGLAQLRELVAERAPGEEVRELVRGLTPRLAADLGVSTQPVGPLDPLRGREIYAAACAACHGDDGAGTGFAAAGMDPPPSSFLDPRMAHLSPHQIVGATRFGIAGTAMPAFESALSLEDLWSVATWVWGLRDAHAIDPRIPGAHGPGSEHAARPRIAAALALEEAFARVAEQVFPSVATVGAYVSEEGDAGTGEHGPGATPPGATGWREAGPRDDPQPGFRLVRSRSGFFVSEDGYLLTNYGAIAPHEGRAIDLIDVEIAQERRRARVVGAEPTVDLAVLQVDLPFATRPVALPEDETIGLGHWAIALGDPPGPERSFTTGNIAALPERECYQEQRGATLLQTSCRLDPESYGGPVADIRGRVFGITVPRPGGEGPVALAAFTRQAQALPIGLAMTLYDAFRTQQSLRSPWLGFSVLDLSRDRRPHRAAMTGVLIDDVFEPSPAAAAGVQVGDVLTALGDRPIASVADFQKALYLAGIGAAVTLHLARGEETLALPVVIEERPPAARPRDVVAP